MQNRAQETAGEVKRVAKEKASGVKAEVRERAQEVKEEVRGRVEERKHAATEKVHALARALRAAGDTLENEGEGALARYGRQAADQVERLASYIDDNDTSGMMRQFEGMARDNPAAFTGTTFAAGLLLGRFLRASRPDDARDTRSFERGATSDRIDGPGDISRGYDTDTFGGYEGGTLGGTIGLGSSADIHRAGARTPDTGTDETGTVGARPPAFGDDSRVVESGRFGESDRAREFDTGFETRGTSFGSGAGHASTGGGSSAGRGDIGTGGDRTEQDRQRSGNRPEGGSSDG
jgi:hypothetical protein